MSNNFISEALYEQFVISQLAPMSPLMTKHHIEWALCEELLEYESEKKRQESLQKELEIWQFIKPVVKFIRKYKRLPDEAEKQDFIDSCFATRTTAKGNTVETTFAEHIRFLRSEIEKAEDNILQELGDIMFFVVAAGSEKIDYRSETIDEAKELLKYYNQSYTAEQIRDENHKKLLARYQNGYSVKEDLSRKTV